MPANDAHTASDPRLVPVNDLAGLSELAEAFEVAIPTIQTWRRRYANFPAPLVTLVATPVWRKSEVRAWMMRQPRRPGRPRKDTGGGGVVGG